jgi:hypothetical protein
MSRWLLLLLAATATARADEAPVVDLLTMGPGNDIFEAFGHGTLCVTDAANPEGLCYHYGNFEFSRPVQLVWDFVRGKAKFWAAATPMGWMIESYSRHDRTIYLQRLPLNEAQASSLVAALEADLLPENKFYVYHHFKNNCTTRLRDHIDRVTGGQFRAALERPTGKTWRELSTRGYLGSIPMLIATELVEGYFADAPTTVWDAMFLPDVLRESVESYFGVKPEVLSVRKGAVPAGDPMLGRWVIFACGVGLTFLVGLGVLTRRRWLFRVGLAVVGLIAGCLGTVYAVLALVSTMPEMRRNELLLVFLPTDLTLVFLRGKILIAYLVARLSLVLALAVAILAGMLVQPLWAPLFVVGGPLLVALMGTRVPVPRTTSSSPRRSAPAPSPGAG